MESYWEWRPGENFPPPAVVYPEEWEPSDRLCVHCTQTDLTSYRQRKLVDEWCRLLPQLDSVRTLWFVSKVPQALFDAACRMRGLEGLWVKWSGVESIAALTELDKLRYFSLGSSTGLVSIDPLSHMTGLEWLDLENIRRIDDLSPLAGLTELRGLGVTGSTWTTQRVRTLQPLSGLTELRYLSLVNLRSADGTLRPLYTLRKLEKVLLPLWWPEEEVEELHRLNPGLERNRSSS